MVDGSWQCQPQLCYWDERWIHRDLLCSVSGLKANWVASSFEEKNESQHPTVRMGNRGRLGTRGRVSAAAGLGGRRIEVQCSLPPSLHPTLFLICSVSRVPSRWLGLGELNPGSSFLATVFVYVSTRRCLTTDFLLTPGNREKTKPQQLSLLKTQNWLVCLISPDGRALFLGGNAEASGPRSPGWAVKLPHSALRCPGRRQPLAQGSVGRGAGATVGPGLTGMLAEPGAFVQPCNTVSLFSQFWFHGICVFSFLFPYFLCY